MKRIKIIIIIQYIKIVLFYCLPDITHSFHTNIASTDCCQNKPSACVCVSVIVIVSVSVRVSVIVSIYARTLHYMG